MKITGIIVPVALSLIPSILAAPASEPQLKKRDQCMLRAIYTHQWVIGSGGPGQAPVFNEYDYFEFQRPGSDVFSITGNPIQGGWQTIGSDKTGTSSNVDYYSAFNLSGWDECKTSYNGVETPGAHEARHEGQCGDAGWTCAQCTIYFDCP